MYCRRLRSKTGAGRVPLVRALSKLGIASRSEAHSRVRQGQVVVDGVVVTDPATLVTPERARITVAGEEAKRGLWRTILLNKPRGIVTTRRDPEGRRTVFDVLGDEAQGLVAVGRLDLASSGLLLLTTDTQLANRLTDPHTAVVRRYLVTVRGLVSDAHAMRMTAGVGELRAHSVTIRKRSGRETHLIIELVEGKNREIRRLCGSLGHEVTALKRVAFGGLELGDLAPGAWRRVSRPEAEQAFGRTAEPERR